MRHCVMFCVLCASLLTALAFVYTMLIWLHMLFCLRTWYSNIVVDMLPCVGRFFDILVIGVTWSHDLYCYLLRMIIFLICMFILCIPLFVPCIAMYELRFTSFPHGCLSSCHLVFTLHDSPTAFPLSLIMSMIPYTFAWYPPLHMPFMMSMLIWLLYDNCRTVHCTP